MTTKGKRSGTYVKAKLLSASEHPPHVAPHTPAEAERARVRLQHLVEIGRLLLQLDTVEGTVDRALAIASGTLPLRTAILIIETDHLPKLIAWAPADGKPRDTNAAKTHAEVTYAYLTGGSTPNHSHADDDEEGATPLPQADAPPRGPGSRRYILIPLVVDHGPIFGALQVEGARAFDKSDLVFVNEVANQLAIAVDRQRAWQHDIAARERAEGKRREAESSEATSRLERGNATAVAESYASLVDNLSKAFVWEADAATGEVRYTSAGAAQLLGHEWPLDEAETWMSTIHPDDRQEVAAHLSAVATDRIDRRFHHRCVTADGRLLWLNTGVHYAEQPGGAVLQGASFDVTSARRDEALVRDQLDFTRAVATNLGEGVLAVDFDGNVTFLNAAAEVLLGCSADAARGGPLFKVLTLADRDGHVAFDPLNAHDRAPVSMRRDDLMCVRNDGESFPISYSSSPIHVRGLHAGWLLAFHDITARKHADAVLAEAVRTREQILAIVAHDLRNPLSVIGIGVAMLAKRAHETPADRKNVDVILRSVQRMARLLEDLADFANIQAGRLHTRPHLESVAKLMEEATTLLAPLARERGLSLRGDLHGALPEIACDRDRLLQVFSNIAGNAIKVTPAGGTIVLAAESVELAVLFSVTDTGPGIPQHDLERIFERYWRGGSTHYSGSGLGLAITRGIVDSHGGRVWAESTLGVGTTFYFTIPVAEAPRAAVG